MIKFSNLLKEEKEVTLRAINKEARKYGLMLTKGRGYYWWRGNTEEMKEKVAGAYSTNVDVNHVSHLTWKMWMEELKDVLEHLEKRWKEMQDHKKHSRDNWK